MGHDRPYQSCPQAWLSRRDLLGAAGFAAGSLYLTDSAQSAAVRPLGPSPAERAQILADIRKEVEQDRLTGVSLALVSGGSLVWEDAVGWADRGQKRAATPTTPFSLASTTKTFTTAALMTLVNEGRLALDASANGLLGPHRLTDDKGAADGVTLRQLASHTAGVPTFFLMYPKGEAAGQPSVDMLLRDYGHLVAQPGEHYEYSNLGMAIIADIVARRANRQFGDYLRDRILMPLGMTQSFFDTDRRRVSDAAVRYDDDGTPLPFYVTATPGSGEMYASAHDLATWAMFHLKVLERVSILPPIALDVLHRPRVRIDAATSYGLGWMISRRADGSQVLHHGGGQTGVKAEFVLLPKMRAAAIVLSNRHSDQPFVERIRDRLMKSVDPAWSGVPAAGAVGPQPVESRYFGAWKGKLLAEGRHVPVRLDITGGRAATFAIGDGVSKPVTDFGVVDGWLSGTSESAIATSDSRREGLSNLDFNLCLRNDVIDGELIAWKKTVSRMAVLPFWTQMRKNDRKV